MLDRTVPCVKTNESILQFPLSFLACTSRLPFPFGPLTGILSSAEPSMEDSVILPPIIQPGSSGDPNTFVMQGDACAVFRVSLNASERRIISSTAKNRGITKRTAREAAASVPMPSFPRPDRPRGSIHSPAELYRFQAPNACRMRGRMRYQPSQPNSTTPRPITLIPRIIGLTKMSETMSAPMAPTIEMPNTLLRAQFFNFQSPNPITAYATYKRNQTQSST